MNRLVVKFREDLAIEIPYTDGYADKLRLGAHFGSWSELERRHGRLSLHRMFTSVSPARIRALSEEARRNPKHYLTYFLLDLEQGVSAKKVADDLRQWPEIEAAYIDHPTGLPQGSVAKCTHNPGHLDPAPRGIGVVSATGVGRCRRASDRCLRTSRRAGCKATCAFRRASFR